MDRDARKNQLAEAVWQVILDQGISAVSVRTVAERAGVAVGSLRHVFPSRAELVQFSAELMVQRATDRLHATYAEAASHAPEARALALIREVLPLTPDTRASSRSTSPSWPNAPRCRSFIGSGARRTSGWPGSVGASSRC
ncbi:TetR/AcrR family transcriptional regulator [Nesterenkonia sp. PF2B19]|uniref:TetR/AcrR family transcriptional regulator n=1 Tax=Nesterenkonia sp. PF2B19 TaxID=1881858 RepID=UPI00191C793B|nr:TetR/AcrR family transcriptional regulator [Nesterenkonia sp. PF2B19]